MQREVKGEREGERERVNANKGHTLHITAIEKSPFFGDRGDIAHWETNCASCKKVFRFFTLWPLDREGGPKDTHRSVSVFCSTCSR